CGHRCLADDRRTDRRPANRRGPAAIGDRGRATAGTTPGAASNSDQTGPADQPGDRIPAGSRAEQAPLRPPTRLKGPPNQSQNTGNRGSKPGFRAVCRNLIPATAVQARPVNISTLSVDEVLTGLGTMKRALA